MVELTEFQLHDLLNAEGTMYLNSIDCPLTVINNFGSADVAYVNNINTETLSIEDNINLDLLDENKPGYLIGIIDKDVTLIAVNADPLESITIYADRVNRDPIKLIFTGDLSPKSGGFEVSGFESNISVENIFDDAQKRFYPHEVVFVVKESSHGNPVTSLQCNCFTEGGYIFIGPTSGNEFTFIELAVFNDHGDLVTEGHKYSITTSEITE